MHVYVSKHWRLLRCKWFCGFSSPSSDSLDRSSLVCSKQNKGNGPPRHKDRKNCLPRLQGMKIKGCVMHAGKVLVAQSSLVKGYGS